MTFSSFAFSPGVFFDAFVEKSFWRRAYDLGKLLQAYGNESPACQSKGICSNQASHHGNVVALRPIRGFATADSIFRPPISLSRSALTAKPSIHDHLQKQVGFQVGLKSRRFSPRYHSSEKPASLSDATLG
jgi:hypothetical protein